MRLNLEQMDKLLVRHTTHKQTSRYRLVIFYNILDIAELPVRSTYCEQIKMVVV